jgi:hypothetical protein
MKTETKRSQTRGRPAPPHHALFQLVDQLAPYVGLLLDPGTDGYELITGFVSPVL